MIALLHSMRVMTLYGYLLYLLRLGFAGWEDVRGCMYYLMRAMYASLARRLVGMMFSGFHEG